MQKNNWHCNNDNSFLRRKSALQNSISYHVMFPVLKQILLAVVLLAAVSCNFITYTPRSKKSKQLAKPSIILLSSIADYRTEKNVWPATLHEFRAGGEKYAQALEHFRYTATEFKIIDSNKMIFYFSHHVAGVKQFEEMQQLDLNSFAGVSCIIRRMVKLRGS